MNRYNIWFQINLGFKCNNNCQYCFVDHSINDVITIETMDGIINSINLLINNYTIDKINIVLLGGEPLLYLNEVEYLAKKSKEINKKVSLWLFTNGILITDDLVKWLTKLHITIILSTSDKSNDFILEKASIIKKIQPYCLISATLDDFNVSRIVDLTEQAYQRKYNLRYSLEHNSYKILGFIDRYIDSMKECLKLTDKYIIDPNRLIRLIDYLDPSVKNEKSTYLVGRSIFVVDPDGVVRVTLSLKNQNILGLIGDGKDYIQELKNYPNKKRDLARWSAEHIRECDNCNVRNVCQGGYTPPRYYKHGRFDKPSPYCKAYKEIIPIIIDLYNKKNKVKNYGNKRPQ